MILMQKDFIGEEEQPGPILSLLQAKPFSHVILFSTPNTEKNTLATEKVLKQLFPVLNVEVKQLLLSDPTDYVAILRVCVAILGRFLKIFK